MWTILVYLIPFLYSKDGFLRDIAETGYIFFSATCHQDPERSYFIFGEKIAVCSRCMFIYSAFTLSSILYPLFRNINSKLIPCLCWLLIASSLIFADAFFDFINFIPNTFLSRAITGSVIGFVLPFYLIPGLVALFSEIDNLF